MTRERTDGTNRYKILNSIEDLTLIKRLVDHFHNIYIESELEIEPFVQFSLAFQAEYWHLKYNLLKDGRIQLTGGGETALFAEKDLNVIWLTVRVGEDLLIECKDGSWSVTVSKSDQHLMDLLQDYDLSPPIDASR